MADYVFVLVTWNNCPACKHFLNMTWSLLKEKIEQAGRFSIVHIERVTNQDERGGMTSTMNCIDWYNKDIINYIPFFPSFFVIPSSQWFASSTPLIISYENIYGVGEDMKPIPQTRMDITSTSNWVLKFDALKKVDLNKQGSRYTTKITVRRTLLNDEVL